VRVVFVDPGGGIGMLVEERLDDSSERHLIALPPPPLGAGDPIAALGAEPALGLVIALDRGSPSRTEMELARRALELGRRVWLHWPEEGAVEVVTRERLASYRRHWLVINLYQKVVERCLTAVRLPMQISLEMKNMSSRDMPKFLVRRIGRMLGIRRRSPQAAPAVAAESNADGGAGRPAPPMVRHAQRLAATREARLVAKAVPFPAFPVPPDSRHRIPGVGVYMRTDFWAPIVSGGSYGHTCYVVKELAAVTDQFVCFMANRFPLLDEYGVKQIVMPPPSAGRNEEDIASAVPHYLALLRPHFERQRPAYIYERLCLGNTTAALLSAEFGVPYIVEYNGSEISMRRSFENAAYVYEAEYLEAEALAFEQATLISVVSAEIRNSLVARGIDPAKILVNPNGVDLEDYMPAPPAARASLRAGLGFADTDRVVGFTGTFGGWHGIDVLSEAIPRICKNDPHAKFLLIGDGAFKHLVENAITTYGVANRVVDVGRVPQAEGARLLKACDIYVSPHSAHMVDSKFFGSPTKVFEYMALAGGIVASDLEQIGQVLSPALSAEDAERGVAVGEERAVLCAPGNVGQFVKAVTALVQHPGMAEALGHNARRAAAAHYSWTRHVANLWQFLRGDSLGSEITADLRRKPKAQAVGGPASGGVAVITTGDAYKDQVQRQWNNDPAGSHYVVESAAHTREWFLEAERHRYDQYAPWMAATMEFDRHAGEDLLEIGGGMGTDLAQFAAHGARVTDVDLSAGHLTLAKENFFVRGLHGRFVQHDAETLVFDDGSFDVVYSNGVLHHTPNTRRVVAEIRRVLRPGGLVIVMVYAEDSLYYWRNIMWNIGLREGQLRRYSMSELMSRIVERSDNAAAHPLVKAYTRRRLRDLFSGFERISIVQRQFEPRAAPKGLRALSTRRLGAIMGWNLVLKARKPLR
jgi:glycosyltransferase involved in cell wall biosynthesis/ubiquinone/menaquinone biosynthesis C-methylase UbiE